MLRGYMPDGQGTGGYSVSGGVALSTLVTGLVAYWSLDETSGTRADSVGSADLTDNNTVGYDTGSNAASFANANDEYLSKTSLSVGTSNTISLWFKTPASAADNRWLLNFGSGTYPLSRLCAYHSSNRKLTVESWYSGGSILSTASAALDNASTHHLLMTYDGSTHKAGWSLDGAALAEGTAAAGDETVNLIWLGWAGATWHWGWDGLIDEVGLWSRVLTEDERAELYNSGTGKFFNGTNFV